MGTAIDHTTRGIRLAAVLAVFVVSPLAIADQDGSGGGGFMSSSPSQPPLTQEDIRSILKPAPSRTSANFWNNHADGWWWYKDPLEEEDFGDPKEIVGILDRQKTVEDARRVWQAALNTSLMNPTPENVERMSYAKKWFLDRAEYFANVGVRERWKNVELDYNVVSPTATYGRQVERQVSDDENRRTIADLSRRGAGIFFVMESTCPYCKAMSPVLKHFQERFGIQVIPITVDGAGNDTFPNPVQDNGIAARLGVQTVPAYFLADPETNTVETIGAGVLAEEELVDRIYMISQRTIGQSR